MSALGVVRVGEDVRSDQSVKQHHVHDGDETQADSSHHQDVARHVFSLTCQPAAHPTQRTRTKHQKPVGI